jgi:hypothetical protein
MGEFVELAGLGALNLLILSLVVTLGVRRAMSARAAAHERGAAVAGQ